MNVKILRMIETSARLLSLLSLLQVRREWTGAELAERLDVGPRTIRRDVDKLRSLGYPVEAARGVAGGYRLGSGGELPPLLLDDAEAVAVAVGLRTAAAGTIAGIEETSIRALAKLEQILPPRLRRRVSALSQATSAFEIDGPRIDSDVLAALAGACRDNQILRFGYVAGDQRASRRRVDPAAVVYSGYRWYLVAFDLDRDDWRTFRIDRISSHPPIRPGERGRRRDWFPVVIPPPTCPGNCERAPATWTPHRAESACAPPWRRCAREFRAATRPSSPTVTTPAWSRPRAHGLAASWSGWQRSMRRSRSWGPLS